MKKFLFKFGVGLVAVIGAILASGPAAASADSLSCPTPQLSEPFASIGDFNQYMLLPGESPDNVDGAGWQLTGGAKLTTTVLQDGTIGQVIDIPSNGTVVTPTFCVNASDYPEARTLAKNISNVQGVTVSISYQTNGTWGPPLAAGNVKSYVSGWGASKPVMLHSATLIGVHLARLTLTAISTPTQQGEYQLYDFYVDPRMWW